MKTQITKEIVETYNSLGNSKNHTREYFLGFRKVVTVIAKHDEQFKKVMEKEGWTF